MSVCVHMSFFVLGEKYETYGREINKVNRTSYKKGSFMNFISWTTPNPITGTLIATLFDMFHTFSVRRS